MSDKTIWLASGFYRVDPNEYGVVLRFGAQVRETPPGWNYHWPYPIETVLTPQVTVVPLYVMWAKFHPFGFNFIGTLWPVIIPNWFGDAFSIFLLRQFFLTIPEEYMDAARVDGCGELRILTTVVARLAKPAIAAVALFSFLYTFNDFFLPLLYSGEQPHNWVLSIGLSEFRSLHQVQWNLTMAATLLVMAPVIVLFFLAQRAFVEGVTLTGVKG